MPNYNLVINSKFNPLSFSDMIQPYLMYKEEYEKQQDAIGELNTKASVWENLANKQTDHKTYEQYKNYSDSLKAQADSMARWGLSPGTRSTLTDLKSRYSSDIEPIRIAYERRQKLADEQRQGKAKGLIYDYDAATTSLDEFVFNNQKDYDTIDLNTVYTKASQTFGNIARELENYGNGKAVDSYTNTFIQQHGITKEQAANFADAIRNNSLDNNDPVMKALKAPFDSIYNSTGVANWTSNLQAQQQVRDTILAGAEFAIGQTNVSPIENYGARLAAQEASQQRLNNAKNQTTNEALPAINPSPIYSTVNENSNVRQRKLDKITQYIDKGWLSQDGTITTKGITEYNKKTRIYKPDSTKYNDQQETRSDFYYFLNSLGITTTELNKQGNNKFNYVGDIINNYRSYLSNDDNQIHRQVEFKSDLSQTSEDQNTIKNKIVGALGNNQKLQEVNFSYKDQKFTPTGKTLTKEDFLNNYTVLSTNNSTYGRTLMVIDNKGNTKRIQTPRGINWANERNSQQKYDNAFRLLNEGAIDDPQIATQYQNYLRNAAFYDSQLWSTNKTNFQTWEPVGY